MARLASQLHPEKPLERGYAIVRDASGTAITTARAAAKEHALKLQFRDDTLDVAPGGASATPRRVPKRETRSPNRQEDLFD